MLALVESTGSHPALADKRERDLPNGVPSNSPPPQSAIANGAHQGWEKHDKSETSAAEFIKTETELRSASPEGAGAERRGSESPPSAAVIVAEDEEEAELLAAEAQAAAQLEEEEAAADSRLKAENEGEAHCELESLSENVGEEELEDKPPVEPSASAAEEAPTETSATSPLESKPALEDQAPKVPKDTSHDLATETSDEPMLTEEASSKKEDPAESSKRLRSEVEPEKTSDSDKTEEPHPKKKRRKSDQSALDLSAPGKEPAEVDKRPSLLLSKLQENAKPRRTSARAESDEIESRPDKIFRNESERAQVLREMRDRVLSSYKAERMPQQVQQPNAEFSELERERIVAEAVEAAACSGKLADLEKAAKQLKHDIRKLTTEAHAKELEWNALIRKRKLKEEVFMRIHRRKQVIMLSEGVENTEKRDSGKFDSDASEGSDLEGREVVEQNSGEELLAVALRLGSRNLEEYSRSVRPVSPGTAAASVPASGGSSVNSRGPKSTNGRQLSLLQSQLSKPQDSGGPRPQLLLQQLQRQRNFLLNNVNAPACRLSPSVSLSAIPTTLSPSSLPISQSGAKCYLPGNQGTVLGVDKAGAVGVSSAVIAPSPTPIRTRPILPKPINTSGGSVGPAEALLSGTTRSGNGGNLLSMSLPGLGCGGHVRTGTLTAVPGTALDFSELGLMLTPGGDSPSSTESSLSGAAPQETAKDVLIQFAKLMSQAQAAVVSNTGQGVSSPGDLSGRPPPPPYPEVTLHPVLASNPPVVSSAPSIPTTSLLHGILTKPTSNSSGTTAAVTPSKSTTPTKSTTFSPTLARLLTAPERTSLATAPHSFSGSLPGGVTTNSGVSLNDLLATAATKARSELTITPVGAASAKAQQKNLPGRTKSEVVLLDDEAAGGGPASLEEGDAEGDDDQRLIIDESASDTSPTKESVPACQSCHTREAEFVCAGCTNQWYCSRECQIAAWDQHSEVCSL